MTDAPRDPDALARLAPTELRPGEDALERFVREAEAVQATVARVGRAALPDEVAAALGRAGATRVALASDLGGDRPAIAAAVAAAGGEVHDYEAAAADRGLARGLDATVTGCLVAVAATGSVVTSAAAGRAAALVAPLHVCVVERDRLVGGLRDLLRALPGLGAGSLAALQSGPSRTADIEKTLILGMHGPRVVHVVVVG